MKYNNKRILNSVSTASELELFSLLLFTSFIHKVSLANKKAIIFVIHS